MRFKIHLTSQDKQLVTHQPSAEQAGFRDQSSTRISPAAVGQESIQRQIGKIQGAGVLDSNRVAQLGASEERLAQELRRKRAAEEQASKVKSKPGESIDSGGLKLDQRLAKYDEEQRKRQQAKPVAKTLPAEWG